MKKEIASILMLPIILILLTGCHSPAEKPSVNTQNAAGMDDIEPVTLAVFYFDTEDTELRSLTIDTLIIEFSKMQEFRVVERERLDKVLEEQGLGVSDLVDKSVRLRVGSILSAHLLCVGSLTRKGDDVTITGYLIATETSEILGGPESEIKGKDELKTIKTFAQEMKMEMRKGKIRRMILEISEYLKSAKPVE